MKWHLIPYVEINGSWSLNDSQLIYLYEEAEKADLIKKVFYEGEVHNRDDWLRVMKKPGNVVHTIWGDDKEPYLIAWLNDWGRYYACCHFITFPRAWGKYTVELMRDSFKFWFDFKTTTGGDLLYTLIGRTPAHIPRLTKFLYRIGGHVLGEIPSMGYDMYENKKIGIVVSYITREDL